MLCTGSRDETVGNPLCSRFCCMYSIKQNQLLMGALPLADVTVHYMDIRAPGKRYDEFYEQAKAMGANYVKGRVAEITELPNGNLVLRYEDIENGGGIVEAEYDLVVLAVGVQPNRDAEQLFEVGELSLDEWNYVAEPEEDLNPGADEHPRRVTSPAPRRAPRTSPTRSSTRVPRSPRWPPTWSARRSTARARSRWCRHEPSGRPRAWRVSRAAATDGPRRSERARRRSARRSRAASASTSATAAATSPTTSTWTRSSPTSRTPVTSWSSKTAMFACSDATQQDMVADIRAQQLDGLVVASCSPKLHTYTFRGVASRAGLNPYEYTQVNIREQCSWVHTDDERRRDREGDRRSSGPGIARTRLTTPLEPLVVETLPHTLVIGGGIAGPAGGGRPGGHRAAR